MNFAHPPAFKYYNKLLCNVAKEVSTEIMTETVVENDGIRDVCAAFDGNWQR